MTISNDKFKELSKLVNECSNEIRKSDQNYIIVNTDMYNTLKNVLMWRYDRPKNFKKRGKHK